jgi:hypothetical protein
VPIINAAPVFGRRQPTTFADRIGMLNTIIPCTLICGMSILAWISVHSTGTLMTFAVVGIRLRLVRLTPTFVAVSPDLNKLGLRMGMSFGFSGIGALIGSRVGGALLNPQTGHYVHIQIFCPVTMLVAWVMLVIARVEKSGVSIMVKTEGFQEVTMLVLSQAHSSTAGLSTSFPEQPR